ncbi:MAG TPA: lytic transglycosylase domain-containing protein [Candidatus Polarisedimenticolaceae bacterium]|nr:lytic transglycosylase domain-containing protein [Candidatus Polarisedimenticolaceae bacterium]
MKRAPLGCAVALLLCLPATGADLVVFEDGRGIRVRDFAIADGIANLTLEAGGSLAVPALSIMAIERAVDAEPPVDPAIDPAETQRLAAALKAGEAWRAAAGPHADLLAAAADRHGLDRALLAAVAKVESNFDPYAVSRAGACGLLQLMPATARRFEVKNVFDPAQNVEGGARYLRWLLDRFSGRLDLALAGYNAGEGAVDRYHGIPPYRETTGYVLRVLDHAQGAHADDTDR